MYTDPSGELIFTLAALIAAPFTGGASLALLPYTIGADLGAWQGGTVANGTANPFKWDYSSGQTWGYMAGGAAIGGLSGAIGTSMFTNGAGFTMTSIFTSTFNSVGFSALSGGQTDVTTFFGFGSFNWSTGEFGYLGKKGNKWYENLAYGVGALGNLSDMAAIGDKYLWGGEDEGTVVYEPGHNGDGVINDIKSATEHHYNKVEDGYYPHLKLIYEEKVDFAGFTETFDRSVSWSMSNRNKFNDFEILSNYKTLKITGLKANKISNYMNKVSNYRNLTNNCGQVVTKSVIGFRLPVFTPAGNYRFLQYRQLWRNYYGL
jgi:hypothetical protein